MSPGNWIIDKTIFSLRPARFRHQKRPGVWVSRLTGPGTHVHVVDAVAAYCPPVVAEVILNSRVPHLKVRREEKGSLSIRWGIHMGSPALDLQTHQDFSLLHESMQLLVKNKHSKLHDLKICPVFTGKYICSQ